MGSSRAVFFRTSKCMVAMVIVVSVHAKYDFDDVFYNQQLLDQIDDTLRPWRYEKDDAHRGRERPRFRHEDGVVVARWYPTRPGEAPQIQWSWEVPPGVNQSAKLWWRPYYPHRYRPHRRRRYCRYGYCRYRHRKYRGRGGCGGYGGYGVYGGYGDVGSYGAFGGGYHHGGGYQHGGESYRGRDFGNAGQDGGQTSRAGVLTSDRMMVDAAQRADSATTVRDEKREPDDDAEEIKINNEIGKLPSATQEQLDAVDELAEYTPFQEQACCGRYDETALLQEDAARERCYLEAFNTSGEVQSWNQFNCAAVEEIKSNVQCVHECLWKLRGTLNEENEVSISKLREFYQRSEPVQWRRKVLDKAIVQCMSEYYSERRLVPEGLRCSPLHLDLSYCIWEELQATCPDEQWNTKARYCNELRSYVRSRRRRF